MPGQAYTVYDTNYEYEVGDTQAREEILITETPEILSLPQHLVIIHAVSFMFIILQGVSLINYAYIWHYRVYH